MHVLISGAGIAGPTMAYFLNKAGVRVTVVEKSPELINKGQNVDMEGSALKVVQKIGIMDQVLEHNTGEVGAQFIDEKGQSFARFPLNEKTSLTPTSEFEILRGDLARILFNATKDLPNVAYLFGTTVKRVITNDDKSIKVALSNGEEREFDLLVAADGQWSRLRRENFPLEQQKAIDMNMYVSYWSVPRQPNDTNYWNIYNCLRSRMITIRPDPYGSIRAMFSIVPTEGAQQMAWREAGRRDIKQQQELIRREFNDAGWEAQRLLDGMEKADDFYFQTLQQIRLSRWSTSRLVCLGDAAYAPTPLTGAGTSLAIIGAYVLAGEISKLQEDEHPARALEAYEAAYRPFVEDKQKILPFLPDAVHPYTAWKRWFLHASVSTLARGCAMLVASPWLHRAKRANDEDFPLAYYPKFDSGKASSDGSSKAA